MSIRQLTRTPSIPCKSELLAYVRSWTPNLVGVPRSSTPTTDNCTLQRGMTEITVMKKMDGYCCGGADAGGWDGMGWRGSERGDSGSGSKTGILPDSLTRSWSIPVVLQRRRRCGAPAIGDTSRPVQHDSSLLKQPAPRSTTLSTKRRTSAWKKAGNNKIRPSLAVSRFWAPLPRSSWLFPSNALVANMSNEGFSISISASASHHEEHRRKKIINHKDFQI
ncbi:hypothetical protein DL93DRAFT_2102144 [Clavulina sp. PMI_390]|nr:hypothetical protein DL93DRAFT_2102144 [Clavulina sp. PMI_390]